MTRKSAIMGNFKSRPVITDQEGSMKGSLARILKYWLIYQNRNGIEGLLKDFFFYIAILKKTCTLRFISPCKSDWPLIFQIRDSSP